MGRTTLIPSVLLLSLSLSNFLRKSSVPPPTKRSQQFKTREFLHRQSVLFIEQEQEIAKEKFYLRTNIKKFTKRDSNLYFSIAFLLRCCTERERLVGGNMVCSCSIYVNESSTDAKKNSSTLKGDLIGGWDQLRFKQFINFFFSVSWFIWFHFSFKSFVHWHWRVDFAALVMKNFDPSLWFWEHWLKGKAICFAFVS